MILRKYYGGFGGNFAKNDIKIDQDSTIMGYAGINISEHDPSEIPFNSRNIVIGRSGSGKTVIGTSLLYHQRHHCPVAQIHAGTEDSNSYYQNFFPSSYIFPRLNREAVIQGVQRNKKMIQLYGADSIAGRLAMVFDDVVMKRRILSDELFQTIIRKSRHWNMFVLFLMQYCMDAGPDIRTNLTRTFITNEMEPGNRKRLFQNYGALIPNQSIFDDLMNELTTEYSAIVINNQCRTNRLEDVVQYYQAPPPETYIQSGFKFGCPEYWQWHEDRYNPHYVDPIDDLI